MQVRDLVALAGADSKATADHVILLWMSGGMSHIDTFDPKPGRETGGEFEPIETSAPGVVVSEILPKVAKQMKHAAIVRAIAGTQGDHGQATYNLLTGYQTTPQLVHPSIGSVTVHELAPKSDLPAFVSIGGRALSAGYMGQKCEAYYIGNPGQPDPYLQLPEGIAQVRANRRLEVLTELNKKTAAARPDPELAATDATYRAAVKFMESPALQAFQLEKEKPEVREAHGPSAFGRGCLLARRLVEQGVRFVQVSAGGFDTHVNNFPAMRNLGAMIDAGIGSLVEDLAASGLLKRTLVMVLSEFGRTPTINMTAGRDHHPAVFSTFMAGGGVRSGIVLGSSDEDGRMPRDRPVRVADLHATVCTTLGIDPAKEVITPLRRPMRLVDKGEPVRDLLA